MLRSSAARSQRDALTQAGAGNRRIPSSFSDFARSFTRWPLTPDRALQSRDLAPRALVDAIFDAVEAFREGAQANDDMTAVAVKLT